VEYLLRRYVLAAAIAAGLAVPIYNGYQNRHRPVGEVFESSLTYAAFAISAIGAGLLVFRRRAVSVLGWALSGERFDPALGLVEPTEAIGAGRTSREVAYQTAQQISNSFLGTRVAVLISDPLGDLVPAHGLMAPLGHDSALIPILAGQSHVVVSPASRL